LKLLFIEYLKKMRMLIDSEEKMKYPQQLENTLDFLQRWVCMNQISTRSDTKIFHSRNKSQCGVVKTSLEMALITKNHNGLWLM
tara:strand:- start:1813 stop:2064 length:252 start_codon:yes stop_codon:yes gene_type:complete